MNLERTLMKRKRRKRRLGVSDGLTFQMLLLKSSRTHSNNPHRKRRWAGNNVG
jgi:hypothetical protein